MDAASYRSSSYDLCFSTLGVLSFRSSFSETRMWTFLNLERPAQLAALSRRLGELGLRATLNGGRRKRARVRVPGHPRDRTSLHNASHPSAEAKCNPRSALLNGLWLAAHHPRRMHLLDDYRSDVRRVRMSSGGGLEQRRLQRRPRIAVR